MSRTPHDAGSPRPAPDTASPERTIAELEARLAARDAFLRLATHELRGPLAAIQLQADTISLLIQQGATSADIDTRAGRVSRMVQRMARSLAEVMDLARASSGRLILQPGETDLVRVVRGELEGMRDELARSGCEVRVSGPARLVGRLDPSRIEQVVATLLSTLVRAGAGRPVEVALLEQAGRARLEVRASAGVPAPQRQLAFGPFEDAVLGCTPAHNVLPLWLARVVVEAHGGALELDAGMAAFTVPLSGPAEREKLAP